MKRSPTIQAIYIFLTLMAVFVGCFFVWGQALLLRPFWMDEVHSWLLISDPDLSHAMDALRKGADYNPPGYYLFARAFHTVVPLTEHNLRVLSAILTIGTATGLALVFARRMTWIAAVGSSLLVCSQSLVILQSTEARFYALWLCLLTWFCLLLTMNGQKRRLPLSLGLFILATSIAGTHYFGIISVGLACGAYVVAERFTKQSIIRASIPLLASVITVGACLPILKGQKAALTAPTWVKPATLETAASYVTQFFPSLLILVAFGVWLVGFLLKQKPPEHFEEPTADDTAPRPTAAASTDLLVFGSLLLMPVVLIGFSMAVQPALVNRYAIAGCLWLVPLFSMLLKTEEMKKSCLVLLAGCLLFAFAVKRGSATWEFNLKRSTELAQHLDEIPHGKIVLFEDRIDYWLLQHRTPNENWFQLDFKSATNDELTNLRTVQRDVGRAIQPLYPGRFPMKSVQDCESIDFYLVPYRDRTPQSAITSSGRQFLPFNASVFRVLRD